MDEKSPRRTGGAEEMAEATRRSYSAAVGRAFELRKDNIKLSRTFFDNWLETLEEGAALNRRALGNVADLVREHQMLLRELSRASLDAHDGPLGSPSAHEKEEVPGVPGDAKR